MDFNLKIEAGGKITLPPDILKKLNLNEGDYAMARLMTHRHIDEPVTKKKTPYLFISSWSNAMEEL